MGTDEVVMLDLVSSYLEDFSLFFDLFTFLLFSSNFWKSSSIKSSRSSYSS